MWESHRADRPIRVPVPFAGARPLYHERHGLDRRGDYESPDEALYAAAKEVGRYR